MKVSDFFARRFADSIGLLRRERAGGRDVFVADGEELDLVTAVRGPGGRTRLKAGAIEFDQPWWPGRNQLIHEWPTAVGIAWDRDGTLRASGVVASGGGSISADLDTACPLTGGPVTRIVLPAGAATQYQQIRYWNLTEAVDFGPEGGWLIPLFIPVGTQTDGNGNPVVRLQLMVSDKGQISGTDYRSFNFDPAMLHVGWNVVQCLNHEVRITSGQYGVVGTTYSSAWDENGSTGGAGMPVRSISLRALATVAPSGDIPVKVGNVCAHSPAWATSAIIWSADDVPVSFYELALPVLEEFGFSFTGNCVNAYANDTLLGLKDIMTMAQIRDVISRGHEVWGHTNRHDRLTDGTEAQKTRALQAARDFWRGQGITTAAHMMALPFGAIDQSTVDLARALGYRLMRATHGQALCTATPGLNPYYLPALSTEQANSWWIDSALTGVIKRGQSVMTYMHNCVAGGASSNTFPGANSFYSDHLRRWCELVALQVQAGRAVCPTASGFYKMAGLDPMRDSLG